jgi:hypothetical protein
MLKNMNQEHVGNHDSILEWEKQADAALLAYEESKKVLDRLFPEPEFGDNREMFLGEIEIEPEFVERITQRVIVIDDSQYETVTPRTSASMRLPKLKSPQQLHQTVETLRPKGVTALPDTISLRQRIGKVAVGVAMRLHVTRGLFID